MTPTIKKLVSSIAILATFLFGCYEEYKPLHLIKTNLNSDGNIKLGSKIYDKYTIIGIPKDVLWKAMQDWNAVAGREMFSFEKGGFPVFIEWVDHLSGDNDIDSTIYGQTYLYPKLCKIELRELHNNLLLEQYIIATHELGHCLGFMHSEHPQSIMHKTNSSGSRFTDTIQKTVQTFIKYLPSS